jgi:putative flippase GtrA
MCFCFLPTTLFMHNLYLYYLISVFTFSTDLLLIYFLSEYASMPNWLIISISFLIALFLSFNLNNSFNFKQSFLSHSKSYPSRLLKYFGFYLLALPIIIMLVEIINVYTNNLYISRTIAGIISETILFYLNSKFTWRIK